VPHHAGSNQPTRFELSELVKTDIERKLELATTTLATLLIRINGK
jgi:hypothetical protein